jgi:hypothetical protein
MLVGFVDSFVGGYGLGMGLLIDDRIGGSLMRRIAGCQLSVSRGTRWERKVLTETNMTITSHANAVHVPREKASSHPIISVCDADVEETRDWFEQRLEGELTFISLIFGGCTNFPINLPSVSCITSTWVKTYKDRGYSRVVGDALINLVFLHSQPLFRSKASTYRRRARRAGDVPSRRNG